MTAHYRSPSYRNFSHANAHIGRDGSVASVPLKTSFSPRALTETNISEALIFSISLKNHLFTLIYRSTRLVRIKQTLFLLSFYL